jgi:hypothetical protein
VALVARRRPGEQGRALEHALQAPVQRSPVGEGRQQVASGRQQARALAQHLVVALEVLDHARHDDQLRLSGQPVHHGGRQRQRVPAQVRVGDTVLLQALARAGQHRLAAVDRDRPKAVGRELLGQVPWAAAEVHGRRSGAAGGHDPLDGGAPQPEALPELGPALGVGLVRARLALEVLHRLAQVPLPVSHRT